MHKTIVYALVLIFTSASIPVVYSDVSTTNPHTTALPVWPRDKTQRCLQCHGNPTSNNPDQISSNCTEGCHAKEAKDLVSSEHRLLKCVYCHSVLHISDQNKDTCNSGCHNVGENLHDHQGNSSFASVWTLDQPKTPDQKAGLRENFHSYSAIDQVNRLGLSKIMKAKIYLAYLTLNGDSAGSNATRYMTCLNCHFETSNPQEEGVLKTFNSNIYKIGIRKVDTEFRDHRFTERAPEEFIAEKTNLFYQILPALIAITTITIIAVVINKQRNQRVKKGGRE
ncbi:MAG: hypothetical protein M1503_04765 [Thaumarchaeota archaeon]|nr:hypothetical protein [Nitrososphaerota archaeon]MCL5317563.1 hypothetical protein [Nitrososphaerota archaeon]